MKVCIDPGHGGTQPGAVGWDGDAYPNEKDFTLDIALKLRDLLESEGIGVVMTREEDVDVDLQTRCDIANNNSCDVFVSIHCNSAVPTAHGTETFYYDHPDISNPEVCQAGYGLAYNIQKELVAEIGLTDRRTAGDFEYYGYHLYVLSHTNMPAVLTEVAFISNQTEFNLLSEPSFRQKAAQGIANGILQYSEESALTITTYSPVDMAVTDPDGLTLSKQLNEIPGATYTETDIDGDGDIDAQVRIPDRKIGDYIITVIPDPDALPTDTYTLEVSIFGTPIILAEDVQVSDIPSQPYKIQSTESGINGAPIADAGPDQTAYVGESATTAEVTLNGSGSYDPDGDPLTYTWTCDGNTAHGVNPTIELPLGTTTISLVVNDGELDSEPDTVHIIVREAVIPAVGGEVYPINKLAVLAPWLALLAAIIAGVVIALRRHTVQT